MPVKSMRRGRFRVSIHLINEQPDDVKKIMAHFIILRAECNFGFDALDYHALSDLFDEVESGYLLPEYEISYNAKTGKVSAERIKN